jgi:hypothetical protein
VLGRGWLVLLMLVACWGSCRMVQMPRKIWLLMRGALLQLQLVLGTHGCCCVKQHVPLNSAGHQLLCRHIRCWLTQAPTCMDICV